MGKHRNMKHLCTTPSDIPTIWPLSLRAQCPSTAPHPGASCRCCPSCRSRGWRAKTSPCSRGRSSVRNGKHFDFKSLANRWSNRRVWGHVKIQPRIGHHKMLYGCSRKRCWNRTLHPSSRQRSEARPSHPRSHPRSLPREP